ncbi:Os04g0111250 [Oryza sativa Japonica Group]|uniref:Os04g0111250 protein n=2 Tax=Oryza sativa subsp. japonica TaxID=39947 RepID=C7J1I2_ORYSJ|nr:Os04g0111250 [Oryza sativa Japonica Group]BAS87577.1 Os04g0111250 [Oryza sativa Japonica Group]|eukprot:NP_001173734.1 Os04g0111250 [Oryza sativa Japonica Group]
MARTAPSGPWSATSGLDPISSFSRSPMARTMGSDMLTTPAPSGRRMQLKCSDWRYSCSRMNPRSGLAHPSASTCAHSTSTGARRTRGSASASPRSAAAPRRRHEVDERAPVRVDEGAPDGDGHGAAAVARARARRGEAEAGEEARVGERGGGAEARGRGGVEAGRDGVGKVEVGGGGHGWARARCSTDGTNGVAWRGRAEYVLLFLFINWFALPLFLEWFGEISSYLYSNQVGMTYDVTHFHSDCFTR